MVPTGDWAIRAASKAWVAVLRSFKSDLTRAGRPRMGTAANATCLATISVGAVMMTGSRAITALRMEVASARATWTGFIFYKLFIYFIECSEGSNRHYAHIGTGGCGVDVCDSGSNRGMDGLVSSQ